jgi:tRNA(Ile)-lysidine synthase
MRAPSEAKLIEMLKQLTARGAAELQHDGARLRTYRGAVFVSRDEKRQPFRPVAWNGERRLPLDSLGGELRFRRARGKGFLISKKNRMEIRLRSGGERLQPDSRRPRRTLKNLFQESGVPPWERKQLPLIFCGEQLVWAPGLGVDARYQAAAGELGWLPQWHKSTA